MWSSTTPQVRKFPIQKPTETYTYPRRSRTSPYSGPFRLNFLLKIYSSEASSYYILYAWSPYQYVWSVLITVLASILDHLAVGLNPALCMQVHVHVMYYEASVFCKRFFYGAVAIIFGGGKGLPLRLWLKFSFELRRDWRSARVGPHSPVHRLFTLILLLLLLLFLFRVWRLFRKPIRQVALQNYETTDKWLRGRDRRRRDAKNLKTPFFAKMAEKLLGHSETRFKDIEN